MQTSIDLPANSSRLRLFAHVLEHLRHTVNMVGSNTQGGSTATIDMYGATQTVGSQDAQPYARVEICQL